MKKLLNTLFVTSEDAYLSLDGENIVVSRDRHEIGRFPLHTLAGIVSFSYAGASPALMGGCAKRDHALRVDTQRLQTAIDQIKGLYPLVAEETSLDTLRGEEGAGAKVYFDVFDDMILQNKADFFFHERSRRPPLDNVNALLSFAYSLLGSDCAAALESVGLDAYVGFLHRDRPGRTSLALDLVEELRPCFADRFVLSLINNRVIAATDFVRTDSGAVLLTDAGRKKFLRAWQERKRDTITHPYLKEKISWGLVPYVQALLLARYLRDDLDAYPPFLWK